VTMGLKIFEKIKDEECEAKYRILFEGLPMVIPYLTKQIISFPSEKFSFFLNNLPLSFDKIDNETNEKLKTCKFGPVILCLEKTNFSFIVWKGKGRLALLIGKEEQSYINYWVKHHFI